jgi:hypothetical protein
MGGIEVCVEDAGAKSLQLVETGGGNARSGKRLECQREETRCGTHAEYWMVMLMMVRGLIVRELEPLTCRCEVATIPSF